MAKLVQSGAKPVASDVGIGEYERRFYDLLGNLFIGVPIEGHSGYVNLMRMKSQYYRQVMRPAIEQYVREQTSSFPSYREELYTKLYTFLKRYIHPEIGSLGLFFTPYHESVYERVYTDDRDVMLFWKTSRLYYVKTDILFRSMEVEVEDYKFHFDASQVEHKRSNEKRKLEYRLAGAKGSNIHLTVHYREASRRRQDESSSDEGSHSTVKNLVAELRSRGVSLTEEVLEQAIRRFEKQSQVDFFLCKDARSFLREQFDLWMWQYVLGSPGSEPDTSFTESNLLRLQALKRVAYRVIDFIAAFEDELVKIWNKPKFVLNSNYVITVDRIWAKSQHMVHRLLEHPGMEKQVREWRELGMVDEGFQPVEIVQSGNLIDELHPRYRFLPIDTKHFKDVELEILGLFDHLDEELDGWLIKSENYQALNTILPKWRGKVKCIYTDPPYNTGHDEFNYVDSFQHSSWISMILDRLELCKMFLSPQGSVWVSCDDNEQARLHLILRQTFGDQNVIATVPVITNLKGNQNQFGFAGTHEYVEVAVLNRASADLMEFPADEESDLSEWSLDEYGYFKRGAQLKSSGVSAPREKRRNLFYPIYVTPDGDISLVRTSPHDVEILPLTKGKEVHWRWSKDKLVREKHNLIVVSEDGQITIYKKQRPKLGELITRKPKSVLYKPEYSSGGATNLITHLFGDRIYSYPKPLPLIEDFLLVGGLHGVVLDPFAGSGTTAHAVLNLNRYHNVRSKYILIEHDHYFYTIILPRIKKVVFSDRWKNGKPEADGTGISHFIKYFELESYEQVLSRCVYRQDTPASLSSLTKPEGYLFHADPRLLDVLNVDLDQEQVTVDLSRLYGEGYAIDLAETLSNLLGLHIRRICRDHVEFEDGTRHSLSQPDARTLLPLLWWNG